MPSTLMSAACHHYNRAHGQMGPDAQGRLEQAAMELFDERGFEQTTVADIAERAGLTKRTFFRYFADKREVLFAGSGDAAGADSSSAHRRHAPSRLAPLDAVAPASTAAAVFARERRAPAQAPGDHRRQPRAAGARADQAASLSAALARRAARARRRRTGARASPPRQASPSSASPSSAGSAEANHQDFPQLVRESLDELKAVTAGTNPHHPGTEPPPPRTVIMKG